jgi:hypothetical protein
MAQAASTTQPAQHPKLLTSPSVAKPAPALLVPPSSLPAQPPKDEPPHSSGRPQSLPEGAGMGRPPGFRAGAAPAYWIWQGPRGGWRVRTTTNNAPHVFRGIIKGVTGPINNVHPTRTEFHDRVWKTRDGSWAFSFNTSSHADGFTFVVRDEGCVQFDLQLDGGPEPKHIYVGGGMVEPSSGFFIVCPRGAQASR